MNGGEPLARIVEGPIDPRTVIAGVAGPDAGAVSVFLGTARGETRGRIVLFLEYEAYGPMARKVLREIALAMPREHGPCRVAIEHRVGRIEIGEASVAIAVSSPHRRTAMAACAAVIERIKKEAPIWKKEHFRDGAVWVEGDPSAPRR